MKVIAVPEHAGNAGRRAPARQGSRHYRALPRRFRRARLLIVGFGDVARRIAGQVRNRWTVIGVARSEASLAGARTAGARALPAPVGRRDRRNWAALGPRVIHAAPPPASAPDDDDPLSRAWIRRLSWPSRQRPRIVVLGTTGVYGDRAGAWVDESDLPMPQTRRARRRADAERQWREATPRLAASLLRIPGIYAADRLPVARLASRLPALRGEDDVVTNHIHADDLARIARIALLRGRPQRTINVVDDTDLALGDYLDRVADWAGLPRPPRIDRAGLLAAVGAQRASFMAESRRIANRRLKRELRGWLRYPTVEHFLAATPAPAG